MAGSGTALLRRARIRHAGSPGSHWLVAGSAAFVLCGWALHRFVTDDAWISVRYAENLAAGRGPVWNPAGPRVEGFSNPGLVAVEAAARVAGLAPLDAARALGVASGVGLLVAMWRLAPAVVGPRAATIGLALTAFCPPLALWAMGGLETLPATLSLTVGVLLLCRPASAGPRDALRGGAALAVLPWLRPEGLLVALAVAVPAEAAAPRRLALAAGLPMLSQAALEGVRLAAFGHGLPNSVLYKTGTGWSLLVLGEFLLQAAPVAAVAVAGAWRASGRARLLAVPPAVYALGALHTFDSANHFSRFLLPAWPALALLAGVALAPARPWAAGRRGVVAAGALVTVMFLAPPGGILYVRAWSSRYAACQQAARVRAARWLTAHTPANAVFSISDAGLVPARAGPRRAIDNFLLNEEAIQRTGPLPVRRRVPMILGRRPDLVVLLSSRPDRFDGRYAIDRGLARDRRMRDYRLAAVARGSGRDCRYHLFIRRRRGS